VKLWVLAIAVSSGSLPLGPARADEPSPADYRVCIQPLGAHDRALMATAVHGIESLYGFTVTVLKPRPLPDKAWYPARKRWRADSLLDWLDAEAVPRSGCDAVVGFTSRDISTTKGEHVDWGVLGLGRLGGPSAVVSSYRMRGTSRKNRRARAIKVVNHELGHVLGLDHAEGSRPGCLMEDAGGTVKTVDTEDGRHCPEAVDAIERLHGFRIPNK